MAARVLKRGSSVSPALVPHRLLLERLERRTLLSLTFGAPTDYGSGNCLGVVIADVNGDGKADLIAPESGSGDSVDVYLGDGTGTFAAAVNYSCASQTLGASQPYSVAVADVNGDGHPDIITANFGGTMSVLLNNGNGTFGAATVYAAGSEPDGVAVGDLNGDGLMDIAVANRGSNDVDVYFNTGGGNFGTPVALPVGSAPDSVGIADFNGDGNQDLYTANTGDNTVSVLLATGNGNFATQVAYPAPGGPNDAVAADFNGDGHLDIATAGVNSGSVDVLLGNGDGTFQSAIVSPGLSTGLVSLAAADFNSDGHADLAVVAFGSPQAAVLLGNGDGTFQTPIDVTPGLSGGDITAGDLNGDGKPDLVIGSYQGGAQFETFINSGSTSTGGTTTPTTPIKTIGGLDPTFGTAGFTAHDVGLTSTAGLVVQSDGKSVIAGTVGASPNESFGVTRYNADGSLDTTFASSGIATTTFSGTDDVPTAVDLLSSGAILVAGTATTFTNGVASGSEFAVAEYNADGSVDTSFGAGTGQVLISFSPSAGVLSNDLLQAMTVGAGGDIFLAGSSNANVVATTDFAIAALTATGAIDTAFGTAGKVLLDFAGGDDVANSLALQSNGDLVAAGSSDLGGVTRIALARFLSTGVLDKRFGTKGLVTATVGGVYDSASSVVIQPKGQIVIAGISATGSGTSLSSNFVVARYTSAGKLDRSFAGGVVATSFGQPAAVTQLVLESNGDILASGKTTASLTNVVANELQLAVARYTTRGVLDTTFNGSGKLTVDLSTAVVSADVLTGALIQPLDAQSLGAEFAAFTSSQQGIAALTPGGELLDVGNSDANTVEAAIVTAGVDLAAALVAKLPAAALEGAKETLTVKISETGTDQATETVMVQLYASPDGLLDTGLIPFQTVNEKINLKHAQSHTFKLNYTLPATAGSFHVVVDVVSTTQSELNATNNDAPSATVAVAAPFVDLAGSQLLSINTPALGKAATISFMIANDGNILARSVPVEILASTDGTVADGTELAEPTLHINLAPGITRKYRLTFKVPSTLAAGSYLLVVQLDLSTDPNLANNTIPGTMLFIVP